MGFDDKLVFVSVLINPLDTPIAQFILQRNEKDVREEIGVVGLALSIDNKTYNALDYSFVHVENKTLVLINLIPSGLFKTFEGRNFKWYLTGTLKLIDSQKTVKLEASGEHVLCDNLTYAEA